MRGISGTEESCRGCRGDGWGGGEKEWRRERGAKTDSVN